MQREEIYDHLAQVYLGKRKDPESRKTRHFHAWLFINVLIALIVFSSVFYGLTAFLTRRSSFRDSIIFVLHNGLVRLDYDFNGQVAPIKFLALDAPAIDASHYKNIQFSIRVKDKGSPGPVKVVITNNKNETASHYIQGVDFAWQDFRIPLQEFKEITDWRSLKAISFMVESWNMEKKKGMILIDNICFAGEKGV